MLAGCCHPDGALEEGAGGAEMDAPGTKAFFERLPSFTRLFVGVQGLAASFLSESWGLRV